MTASPGSEASKIKEICKNLDIEEVELRTRESDDVKEYLKELKTEKIMVDLPEEFIKMREALLRLFQGYVSELRSRRTFQTVKDMRLRITRKLKQQYLSLESCCRI